MSYHSAKCGGHRFFSSRDIMIFICHVALQDHVIRALCDFMSRSPSSYVTILPSFVAVGTVIVKI